MMMYHNSLFQTKTISFIRNPYDTPPPPPAPPQQRQQRSGGEMFLWQLLVLVAVIHCASIMSIAAFPMVVQQPFSAVYKQRKLTTNRRNLVQQRATNESSSDTTISTITSKYDNSNVVCKNLVSTLTDIVNSVVPSSLQDTPGDIQNATKDRIVVSSSVTDIDPPRSAQELYNRIQKDYTIRNYLWTGNIDLSCFDTNCRFTDPTLSFTGIDTFVRNIQNLRPIVDALTQGKNRSRTSTSSSITATPPSTDSDVPLTDQYCRSDLLHIELCDEGYLKTRWNMVGELRALPWKPRIDVIGQTKFWFDDNYQIYFYDEEWEIPAVQALLQIVTPAGTIANSRLQHKI